MIDRIALVIAILLIAASVIAWLGGTILVASTYSAVWGILYFLIAPEVIALLLIPTLCIISVVAAHLGEGDDPCHSP